MGFADNMRILSNITCGLAATNTFLEQKMNGVPTANAGVNLVGNLLNGFVRNEIAYDMQLHGDPRGNLINGLAGYGNPVSNTVGTLGLLGACSPWMYFNSCNYFYTPPMIFNGFYSTMNMGFQPLPPMGGPHCCNRGFWC